MNLSEETSLYNMFKDLGLVVSISDGIVGVKGLDNVANGEVIEFLVGSKKITGMVLNLEPDKISAVVLGDDSEIKPGQIVARKFDLMGVPVGESLLGRVVDPLGNPLDNEGPIVSKGYTFIEKIAPSIVSRSPVNIPLETGLKVVDSMVPIGHGQRELIIGDMKTGKTAVALDTIINQKGTDTLCIYVALGQKNSSIS
jgi:F-type H+-transporting ATPase subunit alpha